MLLKCESAGLKGGEREASGCVFCQLQLSGCLDFIGIGLHWMVTRHWISLDWTLLDFNSSLDFIGLEFIGLNFFIGLTWIGLHWGVFFIGLDWIGVSLDPNSD